MFPGSKKHYDELFDDLNIPFELAQTIPEDYVQAVEIIMAFYRERSGEDDSCWQNCKKAVYSNDYFVSNHHPDALIYASVIVYDMVNTSTLTIDQAVYAFETVCKCEWNILRDWWLYHNDCVTE